MSPMRPNQSAVDAVVDSPAFVYDVDPFDYAQAKP
jgi:hypothetical protein